jgi:MarR family 2-MHQ and catechol resistance regulon transcriptional repressor
MDKLGGVATDSIFRDEAANGELVSPSLQASVDQYLERYPWADGDALETSFVLTQTFITVKEAVSTYLEPYGLGLTRAEYNFLAILHLAGDRSRALGEIAREMGVTPAWVTRLLDSLQGQGLAERVTNPSDRRVIYAQLTPQGQDRCVAIMPAYLTFLGGTGNALTAKEKKQLRDLLMKYRRQAESLLEAQDKRQG